MGAGGVRVQGLVLLGSYFVCLICVLVTLLSLICDHPLMSLLMGNFLYVLLQQKITV